MKRILYIEDEEMLAQLVKRRFSRQEINVDIAEDGLSGLKMLQEVQYDALIVDYQLPDTTGLDLIRQMTVMTYTPPIIMVSGQDDIRVAVEALNLGCQDYLVKEGNSFLELLSVHLKAVIERRSLEDKQRQAERDIALMKESLARAQSLARVGNWEWNVGDRLAKWSDEAFNIFGIVKSAGNSGVALTEYNERVHPDDRALLQQVIDEKQSEFEYRIQLENGNVRWVSSKIDVEYDDDGEVKRCFGIDQDITERKLSEKQLTLAKQVFDTTTECIMVTDSDEKIISINPAFTQITGYEEEDVLGKTPAIMHSGKHDHLFYQKIWDKLTVEKSWAGEIWQRNKEGVSFPAWLSVSVMYDSQGNIEQYVSVFSDISKHKEAEKQIEFQANYDALTCLPNRNLFHDRLETALKIAKREQHRLALLFLDLDRFKWVNDTFGHHTGDALLQEVANRLTSVLRDSDSISRMGGDEFTVILDNLDHGIDAKVIAEKILDQLTQPFFVDAHEILISGSIGITIYPDDGNNIEALYRHADDAMYAAKESGRNQVSFFTSTMQHEAETRLALLTELRQAIKNEEFELYYQPVIDIASNTIYGAEALIRWNHPTRGLVPPMSFIPLAEETGLIRPLGQWVLETALAQLQQWQNAGYDLQVSINKSSKQFQTEKCEENFHDTLSQYNVVAEKLTIEITETVLMAEDERIMTLLQSYRELGIKIALDDFGTGYSSLSYLRKYPFDVLKIDRSFVMDIADDKADASLVETIILMGQKMGLRVVAEGVETNAQRDFLIKHECDFIQGYLYSPPISALEFERNFLIDQSWKENE